MKRAALGLGFLLALSPVVASAEGFYIGGAVGSSTWKVSDAEKASLATLGWSLDDDDTGYKVLAGYKFTPNFAAEVFYADFGEATAAGGVDNETVDADGAGARALLIAPFGDGFDLYASLGFHTWDTESVSTIAAPESDDDTDWTYGVGVSYTYQQFSVRGEYERFELDYSDIDLLTLGVTFHF